MARLRQHLRNYWWGHLAGLISALSYGSLSWRSQQIEVVPLMWVFFSWAVVWTMLLVIFFWARKKKSPIPFLLIFFWAGLFRIAGIMASPMLSEDDSFRFLWDGYRFAETGNPYGDVPADFFDDPEVPDQMAEIVFDINYPELPTIYGPVMEVVFLASYKIAPGSLTVLKVFFVLFEGLLLFLLSRLLNSRWLLFAAWCPLLVIESSFQAHPDLIGISLMGLAFFAGVRKWPWLAMLALGLAASAKIFAILLWPFIVQRKIWFLQGLMLAGVIAVIYGPFIIQQSDAGATSLQAMATGWEFNSAGYALLKFVSEEYARPLSLGLFTIIYLFLLIRYWQKNERKELPPLDLVFGAFFFLSPVINPWYLLWLFPFALVKPRFWSLTALAAVSLSYATGLNLESPNLNDFEIPLEVRSVEFFLIFVAILCDRYRAQKHRSEIPNLNEGI